MSRGGADMNDRLPSRTIVLLGIGHTNAHIVRQWAMDPLPDARLVCVSDFAYSTYSGMLPGVLAGDYRPDQMTIDLVRLCSAAGALLLGDEVTGLDHSRNQLRFRSRPPLRFDALSVGIGSIPRIDAEIAASAPVIPIKPMQTFRNRVRGQLADSLPKIDGRPFRVAVVGGGVAGVEVSMCLPHFLETAAKELGRGDAKWQMMLIQSGEEIAPKVSPALRRRIERQLLKRGVKVHCGRQVDRATREGVRLEDGSSLPADLIVWATGAAAPDLLGKLELPVDERGFLLTDQTLKTIADLPVFAVGDTGTLAGDDVPKAGVFAVRQGPVLWTNLQRILTNRPLEQYHPQRRFLKLLNCGDQTALGEYGSIAVHGAWVWKLKDWIDSRFVDKYQNLSPMKMNDEGVMRCHGCGSKVAPADLFEVLREPGDGTDDSARPSDDVKVGLDQFDDAAVVCIDGETDVVLTSDFFPAPFDDGYLSGRLAALHAMSDIYAMGAEPTSAMMLATLQTGAAGAQRELFGDLLAGCRREFDRSGTSLVGGHTTEGPETTIGFSVIGKPWGHRLCRKGSRGPTSRNEPAVQPGDCLVLTKPLGTGVLLAGHRRAVCCADWLEALLESMLEPISVDARMAWELGPGAMTDVSGFGLAAHLLELLPDGSMSAEIDISAVPVLPGALELASEGITSSLDPGNRRAAESRLQVTDQAESHPAFPLLFDPQTCGGLLIVFSETAAERFLDTAGGRDRSIRVIGRVHSDEPPGTLRIVSS